jgi:hypothetical protein
MKLRAQFFMLSHLFGTGTYATSVVDPSTGPDPTLENNIKEKCHKSAAAQLSSNARKRGIKYL